MSNIKNGIYVTMDALMDTRYGTLDKYYRDVLIKTITDDSYIDRLYDEFDYVNNTIFKDIYSKRDKTTLRRSVPSKVIELIASEFVLMESKLLEANEVPLLPLTINTFPYKLTDKEANTFARAIRSWSLNDKIEVAFINLPPDDITLKFLSNHFSVVIMYEYSRWLDYHINNKTGDAASVTLYVPAILGSPIRVKKIKDLEGMFNAYGEVIAPYIRLVHIPVETYCYQIQYKEKYLQELLNKPTR